MSVINAVAPWEGQLVWRGNIREGYSQSSGQAYAFADFTLKYQNNQMQERYITFSISGVDRVNNLKSYPYRTMLRVSWFPDSREYTPQGSNETRWIPAFQAYNITAIQPQALQQPQYGAPAPAYGQPQPQPQQYAQPAPPAYQQPYPQQGTAMPPQTPVYQQPAPAPAPQPVQQSAPLPPTPPPPEDDLPF